MPRKQKQYHYIYKTTNILNNKFYIGMHSTDNIDDGYVGSGKHLWYSIDKYGKENHICEILEYLSDRKSLKIREEEIVNKELIDDALCMNLTCGGRGGYEHINSIKGLNNKGKSKEWIQQHMQKMANNFSEKFHSDAVFRKKVLTQLSQMLKKRNKMKLQTFLGKTHTEETKRKMSTAKQGMYHGKDNPQYGKSWIFNKELNISKIVKKDTLEQYFDEGWQRGRIINK